MSPSAAPSGVHLVGKFTPEMRKGQGYAGLEIKVARIRLGLHLYEVAQQVGITPARLSQFEGGHRTIPPKLERHLRQVLGLPEERREGDGQEA